MRLFIQISGENVHSDNVMYDDSGMTVEQGTGSFFGVTPSSGNTATTATNSNSSNSRTSLNAFGRLTMPGAGSSSAFGRLATPSNGDNTFGRSITNEFSFSAPQSTTSSSNSSSTNNNSFVAQNQSYVWGQTQPMQQPQQRQTTTTPSGDATRQRSIVIEQKVDQLLAWREDCTKALQWLIDQHKMSGAFTCTSHDDTRGHDYLEQTGFMQCQRCGKKVGIMPISF